MINPLNRQLLANGIRHECGHVIVATELGFATGGILMDTRAGTWVVGAEIDLPLSFETKDDVAEFIEKRIAVLYAGGLAESLENKKIQNEKAHRLFQSLDFKASTDFAKLREISRIWVGLKYPKATPSSFAEHLKNLDSERYNKTVELVEMNASRIEDLTTFFMGEWEKAGRAFDVQAVSRKDRRLS